ncbi:MAG: hypothetical protein R2731_07310 [Nocardioides sp.]
MTSSGDPGTATPAGAVARLIDGGDMDCGSGLLLLITRAMRRLADSELLGVRSAESSVCTDLPVWAELVGHEVVARVADSATGPWWFVVRKAGASAPTLFSHGERTPVGQRLWVYTNFDCNLACGYCCAESSPRAAARRLPRRSPGRRSPSCGSSGARRSTSPAASRSCTPSSASWSRPPTGWSGPSSPTRWWSAAGTAGRHSSRSTARSSCRSAWTRRRQSCTTSSVARAPGRERSRASA